MRSSQCSKQGFSFLGSVFLVGTNMIIDLWGNKGVEDFCYCFDKVGGGVSSSAGGGGGGFPCASPLDKSPRMEASIYVVWSLHTYLGDLGRKMPPTAKVAVINSFTPMHNLHP
jgi:hypothetical protein